MKKVLPVVVYLFKSILKDMILNTSRSEKSLILRDLELHLHVLPNHSETPSWKSASHTAAHGMLGILPPSQELKQSQHILCLASIYKQLPRNDVLNPFFLMFDKEAKRPTFVLFNIKSMLQIGTVIFEWRAKTQILLTNVGLLLISVIV